MNFDKPQLDDPKLLISGFLDNDELSNLAQTSRANNTVTHAERQKQSYLEGIDRGVALHGDLYLDPEEQVYDELHMNHPYKYVPRTYKYEEESSVGVQSINKEANEGESKLSDDTKKILQVQKDRQIHRQEVLSKRPKFRKALAEGNTIGLFSKIPSPWGRPSFRTINGQTQHYYHLSSLSNPLSYENSSMSRSRAARISRDNDKTFENVLKGIEEVGAIRERNREPIRSEVKRFYGDHVPISEKTQISYGRPFNKKKKSVGKTQKNKGGKRKTRRKKKRKKTRRKKKKKKG